MDGVWPVFLTVDLHGECTLFIVAISLILGDNTEGGFFTEVNIE